MTPEIACPECSETENLTGETIEGEIRLTCGECDHVWPRDSVRVCPGCGGTEFYPAPMAIVEKSRGTQLSIMSTRPEHLCWTCGRDLIDTQRRSGVALMPDELPTRY